MGWHKSMLESMARARFCMIVPGDTQSSERLADAFVTGARGAFMHACMHAQQTTAVRLLISGRSMPE